jgi:hypothetical protein
MAELADAHDSGSCARKGLQVRPLFRVQIQRLNFLFKMN